MSIKTITGDETSTFKRDLKGLYCSHPFKSVELHRNNQAYVCCPSWMKKSIGNFTTDPIEVIWNSKSAQEIRESILDGSYRYCDHQICPLIQGNNLSSFISLKEDVKDLVKNKVLVMEKKPESVMLMYEPSCNLSCPSCRSEKISYTQDSPEYKTVTEITKKVTDDLLKDPSQYQVINITGSGDPFASLSFRQFLESVDGSKYPNMHFVLQTNGLLLTPLMWQRLSKIQNNIKEICVSIDAATEESYVKIRRLGHWGTIQKNMLFLSDLRKNNKIKRLQVNFVVQQLNYREIPLFAEMFVNMGCDTVFFSLIVDWGSMDPIEFKKSQVHSPEHPDHNHFISVLGHPVLAHKNVNLGNLTSFREQAIVRRNASLPLVEKVRISLYEFLRFLYRKSSRVFFTSLRILKEKVHKFKAKF